MIYNNNNEKFKNFFLYGGKDLKSDGKSFFWKGVLKKGDDKIFLKNRKGVFIVEVDKKDDGVKKKKKDDLDVWVF